MLLVVAVHCVFAGVVSVGQFAARVAHSLLMVRWKDAVFSRSLPGHVRHYGLEVRRTTQVTRADVASRQSPASSVAGLLRSCVCSRARHRSASAFGVLL